MTATHASRTARFGVAAAIATALTIVFAPGEARADASCDLLFKTARQFLSYDHRHYHSVLWTTNYVTDKARYMALTMLPLRIEGGDLQGEGTRTRKFEYANSGHAETETVSLRIREDGKVMLSKIYGPYDPTCSWAPTGSPAVGYVTLKTGDSIEVFTLWPRNDGRF